MQVAPVSAVKAAFIFVSSVFPTRERRIGMNARVAPQCPDKRDARHSDTANYPILRGVSGPPRLPPRPPRDQRGFASSESTGKIPFGRVALASSQIAAKSCPRSVKSVKSVKKPYGDNPDNPDRREGGYVRIFGSTFGEGGPLMVTLGLRALLAICAPARSSSECIAAAAGKEHPDRRVIRQCRREPGKARWHYWAYS